VIRWVNDTRKWRRVFQQVGCIAGGLQSALASAAMMCGFSVFLDKMGAQEAVAVAQKPVLVRCVRPSHLF